MALPADLRKLQTVWAESGDRTDPDDPSLAPSLDRAQGWPSSFSAADGDTPRRRVMNELIYEQSLMAKEILTRGVAEWDSGVDYAQYGITQAGGKLWKATVATGPTTSNATDPTTNGQTVWGAVETPNTASAPAAPGGLVGTASNGEIEWSWRCSRDNGSIVLGFHLQVRQEGGSWAAYTDAPGDSAWSATRDHAAGEMVIAGGKAWRATVATGPTTNNATDPTTASQTVWALVSVQPPHAPSSNLVNGTIYEARVRAFNAAGFGAWSSATTATPVAGVPDRVGQIIANPSSQAINLQWATPEDNGAAITAFHIQYKSGVQNWSSTRQVTATASPHTVSGLTDGTSYAVRIRAVNSAGNGDWSAPVTAAPASTLPGAPANVSVSSSGQDITLSWSPPTDAGGSPVVGYVVRERIGAGAYSFAGMSLDLASPFTDKKSQSGTYRYEVAALTGVGGGPWSTEVSATLSLTVYAAFVDSLGDDFRLCSLNLATGALTAIGPKVDISTLVGTEPEGCSLLHVGGTTYAAFVDDNGDDFRLCSLNLANGALTAIGSKVDISTLVGSNVEGCSLLQVGGTTYVAFVDAIGDDFRLCSLNLANGALTAIGSKVDISTLVGTSTTDVSLLHFGGTTYAAFVDAIGDNFRLCSLNLTNGALTAIGSKVGISTLVGSGPEGCSLLQFGSTTYAAFADNGGNDFRLCSLNLTNGALTAIGSKVDISTLVGGQPQDVSLLVA